MTINNTCISPLALGTATFGGGITEERAFTLIDMYTYGLDTGGLYSLLSITARMLADNTISLNVAQRNTRLTNVLAADDEITARSIDNVLRDMYAGKPYKAVQKTLIDKLENVPIQQQQSNQNLLQLLETHKYILSEFYAALGIDEPQQMKRE